MPRGVRHSDERYADLVDLLLSVGRAVQARARVDPAILQLTPTEINVMRYIDHHPDTSPSAVAAATGMQRSNLSTTLRSLESKELVERRTDPADSRHAVLRSTPRAAANLTRLRRAWAQTLRGAIREGIPIGELDTALSVLRRIDDGLDGSVEI